MDSANATSPCWDYVDGYDPRLDVRCFFADNSLGNSKVGRFKLTPSFCN